MLVALITTQLARRDFLCSDHDQVLLGIEDLGTIRAQNWALFLLTNMVPFVAAYVGLTAITALVAGVMTLGGHRRAAVTPMVSAAVAAGSVGFLAIFSVGLPLLVAACLLAVAAVSVAAPTSPSMSRVPSLIGALAAVAILIGGFTLTGVFWG